jgi:Mn-dependent DtxR family transcriptional regulator
MLGVARPTVSATAGSLKQQGLIEYSRGLIHIHDAAGLERHSCECYRAIRDYLDNYLEFDSDIVV